MGSIVDRISENKYEVSLASLAVALAGFTLYQRNQTSQLRKIANSIDPYIPSISLHHKELHKEITEKVIVSELLKYRENPIYRIALTGGPCAGKSTALDKIRDHFRDQGFHVMIVPEVPTLVFNGGGLSDFPTYGSSDRMKFQMGLVKLKIYFEDYITRMAEMSKKPTIVLCDRGLVDCAAYMSKEQFQALLDQEGWTWSHLRDKRYDSVIFMNTAAKGAEQFYTLANNNARTETPEQARALDDKTLAAWIGHPYMAVCSNLKNKSFSYKVDLTIKAVQKTIGLESTSIIYHKYLVDVHNFPEDVIIVESEVEQIYLKNKNPRYVQDKVKKRGQDNSFTYQRKFVGPYDQRSPFRQVVRTSLNSLQYATLVQQEADPHFRPVHIKRKHFQWEGHYFSLDSIDYIRENRGAVLLRFQTDADQDGTTFIPPWITLIRDIRTEKDFKLSSIARQDY